MLTKPSAVCILSLVLLVLAPDGLSQASISFNRESTFGAMRISYSDLYQLVTQAQTMIATANQGRKVDDRANFVRIQSKGSTFAFDGKVARDSFSEAPNSAGDVLFEYRNWGAPISRVELRLSDSRRTLEISGESEEQVEALYRVLTGRLEGLSGGIGGSSFRLAGAFVLLAMGVILPWLGNQFRNSYVSWGFLGAALCCSISVWVFPWDEWFPGVLVVHGDASFAVRYAPQLSILGLLATLVTFIFGLVYARYLASRKQSAEADKGEPARKANDGKQHKRKS